MWGHTRPLPGGPPPEDDFLFLLFVDLSKAFDSVNRQRLWRLLSDKLRVPSHFVQMLMRMHSGMQTRVLHSGSLGRPIPMGTGVRQGSVEGPTLYLLCYTFVLAEWCRRCRLQLEPELGVKWVSCPLTPDARSVTRFSSLTSRTPMILYLSIPTGIASAALRKF